MRRNVLLREIFFENKDKNKAILFNLILIFIIILIFVLLKEWQGLNNLVSILLVRLRISTYNNYIIDLLKPIVIRNNVYFEIYRIFIFLLYNSILIIISRNLKYEVVLYKRYWNTIKSGNIFNIMLVVLIIVTEISIGLLFIDKLLNPNFFAEVNNLEYYIVLVFYLLFIIMKIVSFNSLKSLALRPSKKSIQFYLNEKEIDSIPKDTVLFKTVLQLKSIIEVNTKNEDYFSIALNGCWGSGKTSVLKTLEKNISNNDYEILWLDLWKIDKPENVIKELHIQLENFIETAYYKIPKDFDLYFKVFLEASKITNFHSLIDTFKSTIKLSETTGELIAQTLETRRKKKLIIILDDIDRIIEIKEILFYLKLVRYITQFNNCISITSLDYSRLQNTIKKGKNLFDFNDKIFSLRIDMPENIDQREIVRYLRSLISTSEKSVFTRFIMQKCKNINSKAGNDLIGFINSPNIYGIFKNYRDVKLTYNAILEKYEVFLLSLGINGSLETIISGETIFLLSYLRNVYNDIYQKIISIANIYNQNKEYLYDEYENRSNYGNEISNILLDLFEKVGEGENGNIKNLFSKFGIVLVKRKDLSFLLDTKKENKTFAEEFTIKFPKLSIDNLNTISFYLNHSSIWFYFGGIYDENVDMYSEKKLLEILREDMKKIDLNDMFIFIIYLIDCFKITCSYQDKEKNYISRSDIVVAIFKILLELYNEKKLILSNNELKMLFDSFYNVVNKDIYHEQSVLVTIAKYSMLNKNLLREIPRYFEGYSSDKKRIIEYPLPKSKEWRKWDLNLQSAIIYIYSKNYYQYIIEEFSTVPTDEKPDVLSIISHKLTIMLNDTISSSGNNEIKRKVHIPFEIRKVVADLSINLLQKLVELKIDFTKLHEILVCTYGFIKIDKFDNESEEIQMYQMFFNWCATIYLEIFEEKKVQIIDDNTKKQFKSDLERILLSLHNINDDFVAYPSIGLDEGFQKRYKSFMINSKDNLNPAQNFDVIKYIKEVRLNEEEISS